MLIQNAEKGFQLHFTGSVSQTKGRDSIHIADIFGVEFFLHGVNCDKFCAEACIPAWAAKVVWRADQALFEMVFTDVTVYIDGSMNLSQTEDEEKQTITVVLKVPALQAMKDIKEQTTLNRMATAEERAAKSQRGQAMLAASAVPAVAKVGLSAALQVRSRLASEGATTSNSGQKGKDKGKDTRMIGVKNKHLLK